MFYKTFDAFGTAEIHQDIERRELDAETRKRAFEHIQRSRTAFAKNQRNSPQVFGSYFFGKRQAVAGIDHSYQFVFQKPGVFQVGQARDSLHQSQIDVMFLQSSFNFTGVPVEQRKVHLGMLFDKVGKQRRQHILCNGGAGPELQLAYKLVVQQMHLIFQLFVIIQHFLAMLQQQFPRLRQRDFVSLAVEQPSLIAALQLLNVLGDGGLADEQLLRSLGKAEILRYASEYFQTKIGHGLLNFGNRVVKKQLFVGLILRFTLGAFSYRVTKKQMFAGVTLKHIL
ncbi:hypothetical protein HMPREF1981_01527 [Bacteroides pyogenes F0041]|uniref:Uncharacterized protein n=1 Tax=Bacteroides pyogenes F0041 TaxID=1321819 RepID=U2DVJ5_9BACE|nr:hypothetical protein HMPREF1981_01527 [Bacteroides pyogenes F0041]